MHPLLLNLLVVGAGLAVYLLVTSIRIMSPDKIMASVFLGSYQGTHVSRRYYARHRHSPHFEGRRAWWGLDIIILPWPIWRTVFLPATNLVLRHHGTRIYTKNNVPIRLDVTISFNLGTNLEPFIEAFNVFGKGRDLAYDMDVQYPYNRDPETGEERYRTYRSSCLAQLLLNDLLDVIDEAVRHVASQSTFTALKGDIPTFETSVRYRLATPESRFSIGGLLERLPDPDQQDAVTGASLQAGTFDINITNLEPEDENYRQSLPAPEAGRLRGQGEGNRIRETSKRAKITGRELVRNETLREVDEVVVIAAPDSLSAAVGGLLAGRGGQRQPQTPPQQNPQPPT